MRRAWAGWALAATAWAGSGCAAWIEDDNLWFDAPDAAGDSRPSVVFGYGGTPESDVLEPDALEPHADEDAPAGVQGGATNVRVRMSVTRCGFGMSPMLDASTIRRVVRRHENEVRRCYQRALLDDSTLSGRVTVSFFVRENGVVATAVATSSEVDHKPLHRCLARTVKRWTFPVPPGAGPTLVNYPYVFSVPAASRADLHPL